MLAAVLAVSTSCRQTLPHSSPSIESLAGDVLLALSQKDAGRLRELALSDADFREVIWPELPASRPERNLTSDYVWKDTTIKSEAGLQSVLAEHGGQSYELVRVEFGGETTQHRSFLVRRGAIVVVKDAARKERRVRLFGSVVERDGGFKVYSYNVD